MKKKKQSISRKLKSLVLRIAIISVAVVVVFSLASMIIMRQQTLGSVTENASARLQELADSKGEIADSELLRAQNQTKLVAEGITAILENAERNLEGYKEDQLPDLTCAKPELLGKYSMHVRVPENLLKDVKKETADGKETVTYATLNRDAEIGKYTVNEELYLGSLLANELAQIERFRNADGSYTGFSATYFCFADSGIDVLGDLETQKMICYDARNSGWYQATVKGYEEGTLKNGVYWTEPVQDGSGRGISLICAIPVVVDGKLVGVAGSGGLLINFAEMIKSTRLGDTGYSFVANRNSSTVIINPNTTAKEVTQSEVAIETVLKDSENADLKALPEKLASGKNGLTNCTIDGTKMLVAYSQLSNTEWSMVTVISEDDQLIMGVVDQLDRQILILILTILVLIAVLVVVVILSTGVYAKRFVAPILQLKEGAQILSGGNLDYKLTVSTGDEFEDLAHAFNMMALDLNDYMENFAKVTAEKERIGAELDVAAHIQSSMLPCIFPAFPEQSEYFDIYATMNPAKEVGGDFYDFFMVDDTHLAIVMADVSGKGVPAALFMVIAKTLIKDHTTPGRDMGETFTRVNELLCESNSEGLFVTAFEGVLDLATGEFCFVNAGHEMPFICKKDGKYEPYKIRAAFVLAGMDEMRYKAGSIMLEPGDRVFQYTDGVTEATNKDNQLYGMDRLEKVLADNSDKEPMELLPIVKKDIDAFVGTAPQFDDITMLNLYFKKKGEAKE